MAVAASIDAILAAQTKKFDGPITRSTANFKKFQDTLKRNALASFERTFTAAGNKFGNAVQGIATKLIALGAGLIATDGLVSRFMATFDELEALVRTSETLGIAVDKLAGIQLQATNASVSIESIDKALAKFSQTAARDGGSLDDQFRAVAERIASMSSQTEKIAFATKMFGKTGVALIPILNEGADGFDKAQQMARELGHAITEIDAANIKAMDDAIDDLTNTWRGLERQIVVKTAPKVTATMKAMTDSIRDGTPFLTNLAKHIAFQLTGVADAIDEINKKTQAMNDITEDMLDRAADLTKQFESPAEKLKAARKELDELFNKNLIDERTYRSALEDIYQRFRDTMDKIKRLHSPGDFLGLGKGLGSLFDSGGSLMRGIDELFDKSKDRLRDFFEDTRVEDIGAPGAAERGSMEAFDAMAQIQRQGQLAEIQQVEQLKAVKGAVETVGRNIVTSLRNIGLLPARI